VVGGKKPKKERRDAHVVSRAWPRVIYRGLFRGFFILIAIAVALLHFFVK